jgi:hypothetical protein
VRLGPNAAVAAADRLGSAAVYDVRGRFSAEALLAAVQDLYHEVLAGPRQWLLSALLG